MDPLALLEQECIAQKTASESDVKPSEEREESLNGRQAGNDPDISPHAPEIGGSTKPKLKASESPKVIREFHYIKRDKAVVSDEEEVRMSSKVERHHKSRKCQHKRDETKSKTPSEPVNNRKIAKEGLTAIERMILRREEALLRHSKEFIKEMKDLYKSGQQE